MAELISVSVPMQTTDNVVSLFREHAVNALKCYWDNRRVFATLLSVQDLCRFSAIHKLLEKRIEYSENIYYFKFRGEMGGCTPELFELQFDIEEITRQRLEDHLAIMDNIAYVIFEEEQIPEMLALNRALDQINVERGDIAHGIHASNGIELLDEWKRLPIDGYDRYYCDKQINKLIDHEPQSKKPKYNEFEFNDADFDLEDFPLETENETIEDVPKDFEQLAKPAPRYTKEEVAKDILAMDAAIGDALDDIEFKSFLTGAAKQARSKQQPEADFGEIDDLGWL